MGKYGLEKKKSWNFGTGKKKKSWQSNSHIPESDFRTILSPTLISIPDPVTWFSEPYSLNLSASEQTYQEHTFVKFKMYKLDIQIKAFKFIITCIITYHNPQPSREEVCQIS